MRLGEEGTARGRGHVPPSKGSLFPSAPHAKPTLTPSAGCGRLAAPAACPSSSSSSSSSLIASRGQAELPQDCPLRGHHPQARPGPQPARGKTGQEGGELVPPAPQDAGFAPCWLAAQLKGLSPLSPCSSSASMQHQGGLPKAPRQQKAAWWRKDEFLGNLWKWRGAAPTEPGGQERAGGRGQRGCTQGKAEFSLQARQEQLQTWPFGMGNP